MPVRTVREIIRGRALQHIDPDATVRQACAVFERANARALAVLSADRLIGILSERDILRTAGEGGLRTDHTQVWQIMTVNPVTVSADAPLDEALEMMSSGGFGHLPVTEAGKVTGMLSRRDIPHHRQTAEPPSP